MNTTSMVAARVRMQFLCCLMLCCSLQCLSAQAADPCSQKPELRAGLATEWNERVLAIAEQEDGFLTLKGLRTTALMHLAMHNVLNHLHDCAQTWHGVTEDAMTGADPLLAANRSAFEVARHEYPDQIATWQQLLEHWRKQADSEANIDVSDELGHLAAEAVLQARQGDGWDSEADYLWHPMAPGVYAEFSEHSDTPTGFIFGTGWAQAKPFALPTANHFRVKPPPDIASEAYTKAFDEVRTVGRTHSSSRTEDQTHFAMWWKDFVENSHNRLARELIRQNGIDLWQSTRLLSLMNMAIYDAYVSSFENKFHYNHWRPYTAIRWAAHDGNPETIEEPGWDNTHRHTYAFPSYPSAHGTACAAAMQALTETFGESMSFVMTTPQVDVAGPFSGKQRMSPPTRRFSSFAEAARECADSRVYLGIHFRYDSDAGNWLGTQVGRFVLGHVLKKSKHSSPHAE